MTRREQYVRRIPSWPFPVGFRYWRVRDLDGPTPGRIVAHGFTLTARSAIRAIRAVR